MKKLLFSAVFTVLVIASSFATDANKINFKVVNNFSSEFKGAKNVNWKSTAKFVKASFVWNDMNMEAFYDLDGDMIGTSSNIAIEDLPTNAKRVFAKKYSDFTVKEAIQFDGVEGTAYYISAEKATRSLLLKVSAEGSVSVLEDAKK